MVQEQVNGGSNLKVQQECLHSVVNHHYEFMRMMLLSSINSLAYFSATILFAMVAFVATDQAQELMFCDMSPAELGDKVKRTGNNQIPTKLLRCEERAQTVQLSVLFLAVGFVVTLISKAFLAGVSHKLARSYLIHIHDLGKGTLQTARPTEKLETGADNYLVSASVGLVCAFISCCVGSYFLYSAIFT